VVETRKNAIRVLMADDHPLVRDGIRCLLQTQPDIELAGEATNGSEAVDLARELSPDVILLDLVMPQMDGLEALSQIREAAPDAHVLVVTSFADDDKVFPAIKGGALGYILKEAPPLTLAQAIREVYKGELWLHPTVARKVISDLRQGEGEGTPPGARVLTARELEVLRLVARGLSNGEIAKQLVLSAATISYHVSNILGKLHLDNRTQAALYALREGLSSLE
jgi:NarL family two-component system response regulator LiaR